MTWVNLAGLFAKLHQLDTDPPHVLALAIVTGIPTWIVATHTRTTCGCITLAGRPCPNTVYGVIFGCGSAAHHTWGKVLQRFGMNADLRQRANTSAKSAAANIAADVNSGLEFSSSFLSS
jgi:hypothetical protein